MNPLQLAVGWLQDVWHLPVVFKLFLLVAAGMWLKKWVDHRRSVQFELKAVTWPVLEATVVWAQVVENQRSRGEDSVRCWVGVLTYSYFVNETEVGEYRREFELEAEADAWARLLRDTKVRVHVNPAEPKQSFWIAEESTVALSAAASAAAPDAAGAPLTDLLEGLRFALLGASAAGALAALWIHVSILSGRPILAFGKNGSSFFALHIGAMACVVLTSFIMSKRFPGRANRGAWFARGSAKTFIRLLGGYVTVIFVYGWVRGAAHSADHDDYQPILMFSAVWLLCFVGACIGCWSAGSPAARTNELAPP